MTKHSIWALALALSASSVLGACSSDDTVESTLDTSNDCVITSATLGTLKRTVKVDGEDKTYTVTGGAYNLYIDQLNNKIYNPDSLPTGTWVNKLVFSSSNGIVGSGTLKLIDLTSNSEIAYTYTDSTDFSKERKLIVYSANGAKKRSYTVDIRVHKEEGDSLEWRTMASASTNAIASFVKSRALCVDNSIYVFGETADGTVSVVASPLVSPRFDTASPLSAATGKDIDVRSIQYFKNKFYALDAEGTLLAATEASGSFANCNADRNFTALVGTCTDSLFAVSDGKMYWTADGTAWNESATDTEGHLPVSNIAASMQQSRVDNKSSVLLAVGNEAADENGQDGAVALWKLDVDHTGGYSTPWMYMPQTEELDTLGCPSLLSQSLFPYDQGTVLTGLNKDRTLAPFYLSQDNGRTWQPYTIAAPALATGTTLTAVATTVDKDQYMWVICSGPGVVFKGRINRLGWKEEQTTFNRSATKN